MGSTAFFYVLIKPMTARNDTSNPLCLRGALQSALSHVDKLIRMGNLPMPAFMEVRSLMADIEHASRLVGKTLPGFEDIDIKPRKKFIKPELEEVKLFCAKAGVRDAEWFWSKMEGCGWKNGKNPVVDWQRTLVAWKLAGYLPSQKTVNALGHQVQKQKTILNQDLDRLAGEVRKI